MPDDKTAPSPRDRHRVARGQPYEVSYFARKHGLRRDQARELIRQIGKDREKLNRAAEQLARQ
jgi:hypothetical protein